MLGVLVCREEVKVSRKNSINSDEIEWNLDDESEDFLGLSKRELKEVSSTVAELMEEHDSFPEITKSVLEEPDLSSAQKTEALLAIGHGSMIPTEEVIELLCDRVTTVHERGEAGEGLNYTKFIVKGLIKNYPREVQIAILEDVKSTLTEGFREEIKDIVKKQEREQRRDSTVF